MPKYIEIWSAYGCAGAGGEYFVDETDEYRAEVEKIRKLWRKSDSIRGYCPTERESIVRSYNDEYERGNSVYYIGTVAEHWGVAEVRLYKDLEQESSDI